MRAMAGKHNRWARMEEKKSTIADGSIELWLWPEMEDQTDSSVDALR